MTDRFQLAGYFNWSYVNANRNGFDGTTHGPLTNLGPNDGPTRCRRRTRSETASLEVIYQLTNPATDPIDLTLYIEPELGPYECDLEWCIILQKNWSDDRLIFVTSTLGTHECNKTAVSDTERASMFDLAADISYRLIDNPSLGMEVRNHREFQGYRYSRRDHSAWFLGPNLHYVIKH